MAVADPAFVPDRTAPRLLPCAIPELLPEATRSSGRQRAGDISIPFPLGGGSEQGSLWLFLSLSLSNPAYPQSTSLMYCNPATSKLRCAAAYVWRAPSLPFSTYASLGTQPPSRRLPRLRLRLLLPRFLDRHIAYGKADILTPLN